uniref:Uncharacterized protein n=1 Tax=Nelumbo nucifera TaxID=4432 RepID=A0A822YMK7_NELNU|nr:TPA_asm: hypothetical protein HUJ06_009409 [Nelumbo nucifera]
MDGSWLDTLSIVGCISASVSYILILLPSPQIEMISNKTLHKSKVLLRSKT